MAYFSPGAWWDTQSHTPDVCIHQQHELCEGWLDVKSPEKSIGLLSETEGVQLISRVTGSREWATNRLVNSLTQLPTECAARGVETRANHLQDAVHTFWRKGTQPSRGGLKEKQKKLFFFLSSGFVCEQELRDETSVKKRLKNALASATKVSMC